MSVSTRFFRLLKTIATEQIDSLSDIFDQSKISIDEQIRSWESRHYSENETNRSEPETRPPLYPKELVDDLSVFGLKPPSKMEEVKKARNREIRKFHPDKFNNEPEKLETAKQIMQILNAAYDRLETYYKGRSSQ